MLGFLFSSTKRETRKANLLLILTPHVIREQEDLRRIFERKMQERQEFIDRYFVFATDQWKPPTDYTRANGLLEDIRQAYFEIEEAKRLEEELRPREFPEHIPSDPIDLPSATKGEGGASGGGNGGATRRARPAPAAPSAAPPAAQPTGDLGARTRRVETADAGPTLRIQGGARSVPSDSAE